MTAAVVAAFFYLRLIVVMYMAPGGDEAQVAPDEPAAAPDVTAGGGDELGAEGAGIAQEAAVATVTLQEEKVPIPVTAGVVLAICLAVTVGAGLLPEPFLDFARHATLYQP